MDKDDKKVKLSVVIATYNMGHLLSETIHSVKMAMLDGATELTRNEIIVYDDCSTDKTYEYKDMEGIRYIRGDKNVGVGNAFNAGIKDAKGEIVVLMCADDLVHTNYFSDVLKEFKRNPAVGYVTRWYYQFIDGDSSVAVRAWRTDDLILQANNPSGLAFRKKALEGKGCSNKMFIETSYLASKVLEDGWAGVVLEYDAIAVRVHDSTSTRREYWLKRRVSSPVVDWYEIGCDEITKDYVSLVQIKNGFNISAVVEEIMNFIKLRPANVFEIKFWFYSIVALFTPRFILRELPKIYRKKVYDRGGIEIVEHQRKYKHPRILPNE